jgi:hypothetical protein
MSFYFRKKKDLIAIFETCQLLFIYRNHEAIAWKTVSEYLYGIHYQLKIENVSRFHPLKKKIAAHADM